MWFLDLFHPTPQYLKPVMQFNKPPHQTDRVVKHYLLGGVNNTLCWNPNGDLVPMSPDCGTNKRFCKNSQKVSKVAGSWITLCYKRIRQDLKKKFKAYQGAFTWKWNIRTSILHQLQVQERPLGEARGAQIPRPNWEEMYALMTFCKSAAERGGFIIKIILSWTRRHVSITSANSSWKCEPTDHLQSF